MRISPGIHTEHCVILEPYHVLQYGAVGVDRLLSACSTQMEGVVHVGVGGGKPSSLQPAEEGKR